jgi:hypothetical protein
MKKLILIATIIFAAATISNVFGQTAKEIKFSSTKYAVDKASKFTFKLIEVEDSRCPADVDCIWAGSAKVKFSIAIGKAAAKTFEINSNIDPQTVNYQGYEFSLKDLTPTPKSTDAKPIQYAVKLSMIKKAKAK